MNIPEQRSPDVWCYHTKIQAFGPIRENTCATSKEIRNAVPVPEAYFNLSLADTKQSFVAHCTY